MLQNTGTARNSPPERGERIRCPPSDSGTISRCLLPLSLLPLFSSERLKEKQQQGDLVVFSSVQSHSSPSSRSFPLLRDFYFFFFSDDKTRRRPAYQKSGMPLDLEEYSITNFRNIDDLSSNSLAGLSNSATRPVYSTIPAAKMC